MVLLALVAIQSVNVAGDTYHDGDTGANEVWSSGVHIVDDEYNVTNGNMLTIEPGANVKMDSSHGEGKIVVKNGGKLVIAGTWENPVVFSENVSGSGYEGLVVEDGGIAFINYTNIKEANIGIKSDGLNLASSYVEVNHCRINSTGDWGLYATGDEEVIVNNCTINNTGDGSADSGGVRMSSGTVLSDSEIFNSSNTGVLIGGGSPVIHNTKIHNTTGRGISIGSSYTPKISSSIIENSGEVNIYATGFERNIVLSNCTLFNTTGVNSAYVAPNTVNDNINITLLNLTDLSEDLNGSWTVIKGGNISVNYWAKVYVDDVNGDPISNATVDMVHNGSTHFTGTTSQMGYAWVQASHFIYNDLGYWFKGNYSAKVSHTDFAQSERNEYWDMFHSLNFTLMDTKAPTLDSDDSPNAGTTGDNFIFNLSVSDNIGVDSVNVTWAHGSLGTNQPLNDDGDGTWSLSITLDDSLNDLTYSIQVNDTTGNYYRQDLQLVPISDNDDPVLNSDNSPNSGTTGDNFVFDVSLSDNIDIDMVYVNWTHGGLSGNDTMNDDGDGTWSLTIVLDDSLSDLFYYLWFNDTSGNIFVQSQQLIGINDNDAPVFDSDDSPITGTTGDAYVFNISVSDNIDVGSVNVSWTHGGLGGNVALNDDGDGTWSLTIVLDHSIGDLIYSIQVNDTSGNYFRQLLQTVTVSDNDNPVLLNDNSPNEGTTGDSYLISIEASDNVEVDSANVTWFHGTDLFNQPLWFNATSGNWELMINLNHLLGNLEYSVQINDTSGNYLRPGKNIVPVIDNDSPEFGQVFTDALTTGDIGEFRAIINDNIDVHEVYLDFTVNGVLGVRSFNWSVVNKTNDEWFIGITLPSDTQIVEYYFWAADAQGNSQLAGLYQSLVTDNDSPNGWMNELNFTTGDSIIINISAEDNIDITNVVFSYRYQYTDMTIDGEFSALGMVKTAEVAPVNTEYWHIELIIPGDAMVIFYFFNISDGLNAPYFYQQGTTQNILQAQAQPFTGNILDNDAPIITNYPSFKKIYNTTESIDIIFYVFDNTFSIQEVRITLSGIYEGTFLCQELYPGASFLYSKIADIDLIGRVDFNVTITDHADNSNLYPILYHYNFTVVDSIAPEFVDIDGNLTNGTDDPFDVTCSVSDNIGPHEAFIHVKHGEEDDWTVYSMLQSITSPGSFYIRYPEELKHNLGYDTSLGIPLYYFITVYDEASNSKRIGNEVNPFVVSFYDNDEPEVSDVSGDISTSGGADFNLSLNGSDNLGLDRALIYLNNNQGRSWLNAVEMHSIISNNGQVGNFYITYYDLLTELGSKVNTTELTILSYYINIIDINGQVTQAGSIDEPYSIQIDDGIAPVLINFSFTPDLPITNSPFSVEVGVRDNIDSPILLNTTLNFYYDEFLNYSIPMVNLNNSLFLVILDAENIILKDKRILTLWVVLEDSNGNEVRVFLTSLDIIDTIKPRLSDVELLEEDAERPIDRVRPGKPEDVSAGQEILVTVEPIDNFGIKDMEIIMEYSNVDYETNIENNVTYNNTMPLVSWEGLIIIPDLQRGYLYYRFILTDASGNVYITDDYLLNVSSNDADDDGIPDYLEPSHNSLNPDGSSKGFNGSSLPFKDDPEEWADYDNDSVGDNSDDLPFDPIAAIDSDGDGYPDLLLPNAKFDQSTTGIDHIDQFPNDPSCSLDNDGDGYPDEWNSGMSGVDSPRWPNIWLDDYPFDKDENKVIIEFKDPEKEEFNWVLFIILIIVILLILFLVGFIIFKKAGPWLEERNKRKEEEKEEEEEKQKKDEERKKRLLAAKKKDEYAAKKKKAKRKAKTSEEADKESMDKKRRMFLDDEDDELLDIDEMLPEEMLWEGGVLDTRRLLLEAEDDGFLDEEMPDEDDYLDESAYTPEVTEVESEIDEGSTEDEDTDDMDLVGDELDDDLLAMYFAGDSDSGDLAAEEDEPFEELDDEDDELDPEIMDQLNKLGDFEDDSEDDSDDKEEDLDDIEKSFKNALAELDEL